MLALEWLKNAHGIMEKLEATQLENIKKAATVMADSIEAGRWVHTFGCGHATIPVEEMYPRIGSFVSGKIYYVRVRSYKIVGSQKIYGSYSGIKKIKVK